MSQKKQVWNDEAGAHADRVGEVAAEGLEKRILEDEQLAGDGIRGRHRLPRDDASLHEVPLREGKAEETLCPRSRPTVVLPTVNVPSSRDDRLEAHTRKPHQIQMIGGK
jgi:hypothetical protein